MATIIGSAGNDNLVAPDERANDLIRGLGGDDRIEARGGDDNLEGGPGNDRLEGGDGDDGAVYSQVSSLYEVFRYDDDDDTTNAVEGVVRGPDGVDTLVAIEFLDFPTPPGSPFPIASARLGDFAEFDGRAYNASYPDLAAAFGVNDEAGWNHFRDFGAREGRSVTFDGLDYVASYADLSTAFGIDEDAGETHFLALGRTEGRSVTFDGLQYVAGYDDLAAAFAGQGSAGAIGDAGAAHFIAFGRAEGRTPDEFDEAQYLDNYADLASAGLDTPDELALHYIAFGRAEGRSDEALIG